MESEPSPRAPDRDALYELAYDEAVRALSEQLAMVDGLRNRAGILLSVATISTSFLSTRALASGSLSPVSWGALTSFMAVAVVSLAILWPRRWERSAGSGELIGGHIEGASVGSSRGGEIHRALARYMHRSYDDNSRGLAALVALFQIASALLIVETVLWVAAVASMA